MNAPGQDPTLEAVVRDRRGRALMFGGVLVAVASGLVAFGVSRGNDACGELAEALCTSSPESCDGLAAALRAQVTADRCDEAGELLGAVSPAARPLMASQILESLLGAPRIDPVVHGVVTADAGGRTLVRLRRPTELLHLGSQLFWASRWMGAIGVISTDGTGERVIVEGVNRPTRLAVDETNVFWLSESADPAVFTVPRTGGEPKSITPKGVAPEAFAIDPAGIVFTRGDGTLWRVARDGTGLAQIARGLPKHVSTLVVHEEGIFVVAESSAVGRVQLLRLDSEGTPRTVADEQPGVWSLTPRGKDLYWATGNAIVRVGAKGAPEVVVSVAGFGLVFTDSHVYWLEPGEPGQGRIMRVRLGDASAPELIAARLHRPISFAVETDRMFVLDEGDEGVGAIVAP